MTHCTGFSETGAECGRRCGCLRHLAYLALTESGETYCFPCQDAPAGKVANLKLK